MQRVVDRTHEIARFFPHADARLIVANIGGFSADHPLSTDRRIELYDIFKKSLTEIDWGQTELIPQNMAPLPWHFGGQRHQNIFMMPREIKEYAKDLGLRLCVDLAHLQMTCNHFNLNFDLELEGLLPYTAHLHIADASGINGEGTALGTGDIPWIKTWQLLTKVVGVSFIPEIWQGHKDNGSGFWPALDFLTKIDRQ